MGYYDGQFINDYTDRSDTELFSDDEIESFMIESEDYPDEEELRFE